MIDISKIREGDEVLVRVRVNHVFADIDDGRLRVQLGEHGSAFSVDAKQIAEHVPIFRRGDVVIPPEDWGLHDSGADDRSGVVMMQDDDFVIVRFRNMDAPQVLPAARLVRVNSSPAIQAAAE